ncbi:MAG: hypothetical protein J1E85_09400 [Ruminococcus sp.]|nr:hypothetical protein [Ruminococcus sp.]
MGEIEKLAKPIYDWIKENGNPHTQVIITSEQLRVTEDVLGIPMKE